MTTAPQPLTDRAALCRNRQRALTLDPPALFLHELASDEIKERLKEVNRTFTKMAIVAPFSEFWGSQFPDAEVIEDTDVLSFSDAGYDLIIHAMALHWANDPVGQLIQCHRALAADGLFLGVSFGGQTLHELRTALSEAEVALTGGLSPHVIPMGEIRDLGALLQRAGFALPVADGFTQTVNYRDLRHLLKDLRAMGETNALSDRHRKFAKRDLFALAQSLYSTHFADTEGQLPARFDLIFLTGWAPDDSQQKPMRPGSAQQRLADALNTDELILPPISVPSTD
ncbi:MAG: methyltransferase domain-containing protein [Pseudoruegeria sp.]